MPERVPSQTSANSMLFCTFHWPLRGRDCVRRRIRHQRGNENIKQVVSINCCSVRAHFNIHTLHTHTQRAAADAAAVRPPSVRISPASRAGPNHLPNMSSSKSYPYGPTAYDYTASLVQSLQRTPEHMPRAFPCAIAPARDRARARHTLAMCGATGALTVYGPHMCVCVCVC